VHPERLVVQRDSLLTRLRLSIERRATAPLDVFVVGRSVLPLWARRIGAREVKQDVQLGAKLGVIGTPTSRQGAGSV
jgi:hypothetical protein